MFCQFAYVRKDLLSVTQTERVFNKVVQNRKAFKYCLYRYLVIKVMEGLNGNEICYDHHCGSFVLLVFKNASSDKCFTLKEQIHFFQDLVSFMVEFFTFIQPHYKASWENSQKYC